MKYNLGDFFQNCGFSENDFLKRGLRSYEQAQDLMLTQKDENGRIHELTPEACRAWHRMRQSAQEDGCKIFIVSAYRSIQRQAEIIQAKHSSGIGYDDIFSVSAPPGFSEHHTGRAVDISTPGYPALQEDFENSFAFSWLDNNASKFGFSMSYPRENSQGFVYEPWHWCYNET